MFLALLGAKGASGSHLSKQTFASALSAISRESLLRGEQCCCGTLLRPHLLRACIDLCLSL